MKFLRIKVVNYADGSMRYPDGWLDTNSLEHLYYDDLAAGICWLFAAVTDEDFKKITDMANVEEFTLVEFQSLLEPYEPKIEEITDEAAVRRIEIRSKSGLPLATDDLKAIDPYDPAPGICYKKRFIDRVKIRAG